MKIYKITESSDYLGVSINTLKTLANNGKIKSFKTTGGFIYILECGMGFKIGKTKNIKARNKIFEVKMPFKYWIIITAKTFDYHKVERDLHKMYESKRINGEWFALTYDDIDNIIFYLNSNGIKAKRMDTTKSGCGFMENKGV